MFKKFISLDKDLFSIVNQKYTNSFFDILMPIVREPMVWIPFYLFLVIWSLLNFGKKGLYWILFLGSTAGVTDLISSKIIKPLIGRNRPCNDIELADTIRILVTRCGQNGSFTSSHAANHFGLAMFLFVTLHKIMGHSAYLFFLWAGLISYAQVYVGVHFPFDIIGGAILGCLIGHASGRFFNNKLGGLNS